MSILCSLKNINLSFGQKVIYDNAELTISKGDKIGLIGLNGQGKSTLFKILMGEVEPDTGSPPFIFDKNKADCTIFLVPQELNIKDYKDLKIKEFFLSFYPELYLIHNKLKQIETDLCDPNADYDKLLSQQEKLFTKFENLQGWNIQNSYESYLRVFNLLDLDRNVDTLSGGEQRKMALSIGLSSNSELILWDEPTNHLDIESIEQFEDELTSCNKTYMVITHDRYLLNHTTKRIVHIERGSINSFAGTYLTYLEYLENRENELKKNLDKLENRHRRELAWMRQGIKARGTRSKKRVEGYNNIKDDIKSLKSRSRKVVDLNLLHSGRKTKQLIKIDNGTFSFPDKVIFNKLDLLIAKKDKIALIGPNGAGKTTLLKIVEDKLQLTSGELKRAANLHSVCFDQKRESLDLKKTPMEVVGEGLDFVNLANGEKKHVVSYLESFLFTSDQANRPIETLSGGEKNRLQLAIFMKQAADLWIFDEPTNDLDIETIELLERELKDYESAVIIVGHDRAFLDNVCDTTWLVHDQTLEIFEGGYSQVAPYMQALEFERRRNAKNKTQTAPKIEVKIEAPVEISKDKDTKIKKVSMNYNEKQRWKVIDKEVSNAESNLETITARLAEFNFGTMDNDTQKVYDELNTKNALAEKTLEKLYAEWEDLSGKEA
jgi:ATP-binding cassette subfamily F protein uup